MINHYETPFDLDLLQEIQEAFFFKKALDLYIPFQVGQFVGDENQLEIASVIDTWLNNSKQSCLLLLGDSGSGKTLFGQWLTRFSFKYHERFGRIPLFIPLLSQKNPTQSLIDDYLKDTLGIEDEHQRNAIKMQPLLLILDGYDEMHQEVNLYQSNKLWELDVKVIISCRSQALEHINIYDYNSLFQPCCSQNILNPEGLQEYVIHPFTEDKMDAYLQKYAKLKAYKAQALDWLTYKNQIEHFPGLKFLLTSPFMLSIAVKVLPSIIARHSDKKDIEKEHLTRMELYEYFVECWFARQKEKLFKAGHIPHDYPIEILFEKCSKAIAIEMLRTNQGSISLSSQDIIPFLFQGDSSFFGKVQSSQVQDTFEQSNYFTDGIDVDDRKIRLSLILSGCPLMQLKQNAKDDSKQYAFLHTSLMEFFAAKKLFEGVIIDTSIALGCELNERLLMDNKPFLHVLAERVAQDNTLQNRLLEVVLESRYDSRVEIAAANAITILNYADVSFANKDLHGIYIQAADLSFAQLDNTNLRDSDVRRTIFLGAWLNKTKLNGALMKDSQFGELPSLLPEGQTTSIAYSPDGRHLAVGTVNGSIQLWEFESKRWIYFPIKEHSKAITCLAFSINSKSLASGSEDTTIRIWDMDTLKSTLLNGHDAAITCLTFIKDSSINQTSLRLASGSKDKSLRIWNIMPDRTFSGVLNQHHAAVNCLASSPDGRYLASGGEDNQVCIWSVITQQLITAFPGIKGEKGYGPSISMNNSTTQNGEIQFGFQGFMGVNSSAIQCITFNSDSTMLIFGSKTNSVHLWNLQRAQYCGELKGHSSFVNCLALSPDGSLLASGSSDNSIRLWDIKNQKMVAILNGHTEALKNLVFDPTGKTLVSCALPNTAPHKSQDKYIRFFNLAHHKPVILNNNHVSVSHVAISPDSKIIAASSFDKTIRLWDTKTQRLLGVLKKHTHGINSIDFSPDGKFLVSGSDDKMLYVWDVTEQKWLEGLSRHQRFVNAVAFSPCGTFIASCSDDTYAILWDIKRDKQYIFNLHNEPVTCLAFNPNGSLLATGGGLKHNHIYFWDVIHKRYLGVQFTGHTDFVNYLAFSPNGNYLASAGQDNTVCLWDTSELSDLCFANLSAYPSNISLKKYTISIGNYTKTINLVRPPLILQGHTRFVWRVAFSPDGKYLVSGGFDNRILLWDLETKKLISSFELASPPTSLIFKMNDTNLNLYVSSSYAMYYFAISQLQTTPEFTLLQRIGNDYGLVSKQLNLAAVVELDTENEQLLKQRGAKGILSAKRAETFLKGHRQVLSYDAENPRHDFFTSLHPITPESAMVSMVRKANKNHVFLVIESIQGNTHIITCAEFFLETRHQTTGNLFMKGQGLIEIYPKPLIELQKIAGELIYKSWNISAKAADDLLKNLKEDRDEKIQGYVYTGGGSLYSLFQPFSENHNCLTWCEKHLNQIGVDLSQQKQWFDCLFADPSIHLPDDLDDESSTNCTLF